MDAVKRSFDIPKFKEQYENYIGGEWVAPKSGEYFDCISPVDGKSFTKVARSNEADIEAAVDAAHAAFETWGKTSATERSNILLKIADRMEQNLELLARCETWDNGKPIRETTAADLPLAIDHFRYFASVDPRRRRQRIGTRSKHAFGDHSSEPLGVVGQIIPWNFPLLMATWKLAPALAAGNCVVIKPAEQTPASIMVWAELVGDLLPKGVLNIVNGFGVEAGKPLATNPRIAKVAFTGETTTGRLIMQYASQNLIPVTLELGGKSPNIFFESVMDADDEFFDKCLEGATLFALNQGEVCTCPSRVLVQESIADKFIPRFVERTKQIKMGHPLDPTTMMGAQASQDQYEKILNYLQIGKDEGAEVSGRRQRLQKPRPRRRLLHRADHPERPQQNACLSGRDLRPGHLRHDLQRRSRSHRDRQRHALRPRGRRLDPRCSRALSRPARHPGRPRLGKQLPQLPGPRPVRRIQKIGLRPRKSPDDARPLPPDEEYAYLL